MLDELFKMIWMDLSDFVNVGKGIDAYLTMGWPWIIY